MRAGESDLPLHCSAAAGGLRRESPAQNGSRRGDIPRSAIIASVLRPSTKRVINRGGLQQNLTKNICYLVLLVRGSSAFVCPVGLRVAFSLKMRD